MGTRPADVSLRPWSDEDLPLLQRLMGDPRMMEHLGGPETPQQIIDRHDRYLHGTGRAPGPMFVVLFGPQKTAAGSIGY